MGTHFRGRRDEVRALDTLIKLVRATTTVQARLEEGLRRHDLTDNQLGVLEALLHLGPMRQNVLGHKQLTSRANVTLIVDRLAARGWVRREPDPHDRRAILVRLTDAGRRFVSRTFPDHVGRVVDCMSALRANEQEELGRLCRKLGRENAKRSG